MTGTLSGTLAISQKSYADELATEYGVVWGKRIHLSVSVKLRMFDVDEEAVGFPFRELVELLIMWMAMHWECSACCVARYCASASIINWSAAIVGILGNVKRTSTLGI